MRSHFSRDLLLDSQICISGYAFLMKDCNLQNPRECNLCAIVVYFGCILTKCILTSWEKMFRFFKMPLGQSYFDGPSSTYANSSRMKNKSDRREMKWYGGINSKIEALKSSFQFRNKIESNSIFKIRDLLKTFWLKKNYSLETDIQNQDKSPGFLSW